LLKKISVDYRYLLLVMQDLCKTRKIEFGEARPVSEGAGTRPVGAVLVVDGQT